jgi:hypothetical protein
VVGSQPAVAVGEAEKGSVTAVQMGEGKKQTGFLHERLIGAQAVIGWADE